MSNVANCNISRTMPTSVSITKSNVSICVGNTYKLKAEVSPSKTAQSVNWSSSNTSVATVDVDGTVTAKKAGTVTITASSKLDSSKKASCTVIVEERITLSITDCIFISQLIDPDCSFNRPDSNYSFDFDKAYSLLQLFKETEAKTGSSRISASTLENLGYCASGQGQSADALFNMMYGDARTGKTMFEQMAEDNARWQAQLNTALSFMYFNTIFNSPKKIVITDSTFSPLSRLDMIEKQLLENGYTYKLSQGRLITEYAEGGIFKPTALEHVFLGQYKGNKVSGYHYEGVSGSPCSIVSGTKTNPDKYGVYEAKVTNKSEKSTFFPKSMTPAQIVDEMKNIYSKREYISRNKWRGYFSNGMEVNFYLDQDNKIISFFPIYKP